MVTCKECSNFVGRCGLSMSHRLMDDDTASRHRVCVEFKDKTTPFNRMSYRVIMSKLKEGNNIEQTKE